MANTIYVVQKGDTLSKIAQAYNTTVDKLVELNKLSDANYIVVGQTLIVSGKATTIKKNTSSKAKILTFGLQSDTDRTLYAAWSWDKSNTKNYQVRWSYDTGDGVWFEGDYSDVTSKQDTYTAPTNAKAIKFTVRPVSTTKTKNGKEVSHWTADWSTTQTYDFINNPPSVPPVPSVEVEDFKLTAKLENLDVNATSIHFKVVQDDDTVYKVSDTTIRTETNSAQYACMITAGHSYKVACRSARSTIYSEWSEFSEAVYTIPSNPIGFTVCRAKTKDSVYFEWEAVNTAKKYAIEYAVKREYFEGSNLTTTTSDIEGTTYILGNLDTGIEYFFRLKAINDEGESGWSEISSCILGEKPSAPTTWSSTTAAIAGEPINLYWVHNSRDGSSQTMAQLELTVNGITATETIPNSTDENEKDKTSVYTITSKQTAGYTDSSEIKWRVRTAGVITDEWSEWSIERVITVHVRPTLSIAVTDISGNSLSVVNRLPFYIKPSYGPANQKPIGYHFSIVSNELYETVDDIGNTKVVSKGEEIFSKYYDISSTPVVELSANNADFKNNISYTAKGSVTMESGLTATNSSVFRVSWADVDYEPNAEIGIDYRNLSAIIRPYCEDENENLISSVRLSVYRREFDGSFTEIIKNVQNSSSLYVTDPHPALDYARYRIVATDTNTSTVSYCDLAGYPVGETAIVMQWDEEWQTFDTNNSDVLEERPWSGSILKLPYNVDVSDSHASDVSMVEYIGRKRPVAYYGTQLGETAVWNVSIPKDDRETLYGIRRLAIWMGNVYVREPSGSGYWANVSVSYNQKHLDLTIPVTLNITRVEGGA